MKKLVFALLGIVVIQSALAQMPSWSYDAGPDASTEMGKELIDLTAQIPNFPEISNKIIGIKQKFRPAFGPIPWRMRQDENKTKILFIGQDGTHIAEAAGRPATAGFGGRAQDLAMYFGVSEGAAFINTYAFTIKGQYGVYNTPYVYDDGVDKRVEFSNLVSNNLWAMSQGLNSPIVKWRNNLIDWIIRNNRKSMKLIVLFGGAARDAIATYAISKGAEVASYSDSLMDKIQVPETNEEYAGGNNTFPSLAAKDGKDLYAKMQGKSKLNYSNANIQQEVVADLQERLEEYLNEMVFTKGGPYKNGLLNAAQLGGYNLSRMMINGMRTRSLKGLTLNDGTQIEEDILVVELPHPSALSMTVMNANSYSEGTRRASEQVMRKVGVLDYYARNGWYIEPDKGFLNQYSLGKDYEYGRTDIGPEYYDFGTPENRMVSKSTAKRMGGAANVVIIGTRENGKFDRNKIRSMTNAKPAKGINEDQLFLARPSTLSERYKFDGGPGEVMAKIMKTSLKFREIYKEKEGMDFDKDGIDAFNIKTHPSVGDFGHYRGTFNNPKVIVLADPIGYDDIVTSRALTGERGQYLQGMMNDLGIDDQYLVIKTVPFGMDGATASEWATILEQTKEYRDNIFAEVMKTAKPLVIMADGENALAEANRIFANSNVKVINLKRSVGSLAYGFKDAFNETKELLNLTGKFSGDYANIPRTHLPFYARVWEGTSGDRVITSAGTAFKGIAFAEVVPSWVYKQKLDLKESSEIDILKMVEEFRVNNLPLPNESIPRYLRRMEQQADQVDDAA